MADDTRDRLVKKRDDLKELRELLNHVHGRVYFKILTCSPNQAFPPEVWRILTGVAFTSLKKNIPIEGYDYYYYERVDPFPGGLHCLWWWGSPKSVEEFRKWADETAIALWEYQNFLPARAPDLGYYGTLATLCEVACKAALGKPPLVDKWRVKADGHPWLPPVAFHVLDVEDDAVTFALGVLDHLLGNVPRLQVDVAGQNVGWEGITYAVSKELALIMDLLLKNLGKGPLTAKAMIATYPQDLEGVHFNRTLRKNLQKPLRDLVMSKPGQGWWLKLD
jgi:hypothetical protein